MAQVEFLNYTVLIPSKGEVVANGVLNGGQIYFLSGPSGVGKTTFLRSVAGLAQDFERGQLLVDGRDVCNTKGTRPLSMVFQGPQLFSHLSVFENLLISFESSPFSRELSNEIKKKRSLELLSELEIADKIESQAFSLSGGEQQKAAICRALLAEAPFVLFDEPFSALDENSFERVFNLLKKQASQTNSVYLVANHRPITNLQN